MERIINIIGSGFSILAGIFAFWQAKRASKVVRNIEKKIRKNMDAVYLSKLNGLLEIAIQEIKVFGPVSSEEKLKGIDNLKVSENIQNFVINLKENYTLLKKIDREKAKIFWEEIEMLLTQFGVENKSIEELKPIGSKILSELANFSSILKTNLSGYIEKS